MHDFQMTPHTEACNEFVRAKCADNWEVTIWKWSVKMMNDVKLGRDTLTRMEVGGLATLCYILLRLVQRC